MDRRRRGVSVAMEINLEAKAEIVVAAGMVEKRLEKEKGV